MNSVGENAFLAPRRASSTRKKGMFSNVERPLLTSSECSFLMERRVINEISSQILLVCSAFPILSLVVFL